MSEERELVMEVQLTVIDNLGINMYTSLPPVISEIVANAWDADAPEVEIEIPDEEITDDYKITIKDTGTGMTFDEINSAYLKIGRHRRDVERTDESSGGRKILGRKGIGKLSVFGVGETVRVQSVKDHHKVIFEMNIDDIRGATDGKYHPELLVDEETDEASGVIVEISGLKRTNKISIAPIRKGLAQRFSILDENFVVKLNGESITAEARNLKEAVEQVWNVEGEEVLEGCRVNGWIGTLPTPIKGDMKRGVVIMARGKLIQTPTLFEVSGGKELAYNYLIGELHADFLDDRKDLIAAHRGEIVWESEEGQALKEWGFEKLKTISKEWNDERIRSRESVIRDEPTLKIWIDSLEGPEKKMADKMIRVITADANLSSERAIELGTHVKDSFELDSFKILAAQISETPTERDTQMLELLKDWQYLESRELYKLFEGRIQTIKKFQEYVETNAREVPTIHNFFKEFPWVLDPRWTDFEDEVTYTTMLKDKFPDEEVGENRRIDFLCIGFGDTIHVVELKRPGYRIKEKDLEQIARYVAFIKGRLGTDPDIGYRDAAGYLVCGEIGTAPEIRELIRMNENSRIYTRRYQELLAMAERMHEDYMVKYNAIQDARQQEVGEQPNAE